MIKRFIALRALFISTMALSQSSDFSKPVLTDQYTSVVSEINSLANDLSKGLDPATTNPTNISTNAVRWNSANGYWEKFNGATWNPLTPTYNIVVSNANQLNTSRNIALTGDVTGSASFNGSANASIATTLPNVNANPGTVGSSTAVPVITTNAKGQVTGVSSTALTIPTQTSQLTNNSGYITNVVSALGYTPYNSTNPAGYVTSSGSVAYATNAGTASNGGVQSVNGQTGNVTVSSPTKLSQLTNDAGFITASANVSSSNYATSAGNGIKSFGTHSDSYSCSGNNYLDITLTNGTTLSQAVSSFNNCGGGGNGG